MYCPMAPQVLSPKSHLVDLNSFSYALRFLFFNFRLVISIDIMIMIILKLITIRNTFSENQGRK